VKETVSGSIGGMMGTEEEGMRELGKELLGECWEKERQVEGYGEGGMRRGGEMDWYDLSNWEIVIGNVWVYIRICCCIVFLFEILKKCVEKRRKWQKWRDERIQEGIGRMRDNMGS
jgi:hypothetical protein